MGEESVPSAQEVSDYHHMDHMVLSFVCGLVFGVIPYAPNTTILAIVKQRVESEAGAWIYIYIYTRPYTAHDLPRPSFQV